jgi:hypothetical protein
LLLVGSNIPVYKIKGTGIPELVENQTGTFRRRTGLGVLFRFRLPERPETCMCAEPLHGVSLSITGIRNECQQGANSVSSLKLINILYHQPLQ